MELSKSAILVADIPVDSRFPIHNRKLEVEKEGVHTPDDFEDEQVLVLRDGDKIHILTGCSHRNLPNIVNAAIRATRTAKIGSNSVDSICKEPTIPSWILSPNFCRTSIFENIYPCHCTGLTELFKLAGLLGSRFKPVSTGDIITL